MRQDERWSWELYIREEDKILRSIRGERNWEEYRHEPRGVGLVMSENLKSLRRFRIWEHKGACVGCGVGSGAYEEGVHMLYSMETDKEGEILLSEWKRTALLASDLTEKEFFTLLKKRTGVLKMGGVYIHPLWRYMTYWETFAGYKPAVPIAQMLPEARKWLLERHSL